VAKQVHFEIAVVIRGIATPSVGESFAAATPKLLDASQTAGKHFTSNSDIFMECRQFFTHR
jgi:hypothetical protein